jgi:hypothetical protein
MATTKERFATLDLWAASFPDFITWNGKFLLRRHGPVLSGICLDEMRDPKTYRPTFFFHNLVCDWPFLTLGYGVSLRRRGVPKALKYGSVGDEPAGLKDQIESARLPATFSLFLKHISETRRGALGPTAVYLPHALRDVMSVGSYLGDAAFFIDHLASAADLINSSKSVNLQPIGSAEQWARDVGNLLSSDLETRVRQNIQKLRLPSLTSESLPYIRPENFPNCV